MSIVYAMLGVVKNWGFFRLVQRVCDAAAVLCGFLAAYFIYHSNSSRSVPYSLFDFMVLGLVAVLLFQIVFTSSNLYQKETSLLNIVETRRLLLSWTFGSLLLFVFAFYVRAFDLSRLMLTWALTISLVFLLIERGVLHSIGVRLLLRGRNCRRALIYGAGVVGRHLYKRIHHSPGLGIKVIGFLDDDLGLTNRKIQIREVNAKNGNEVLGSLANIEALISSHRVNEVYVAMPSASYQRNLEIAEQCRKLGLKVAVVPPTYGNLMYTLKVKDIGGIPVIQEKQFSPSVLYPFIKRIFDVVVSIVATVLLSPIMLAIAIAIKLDSNGPIIFKQKRIGLGGREFDFYKFRSMYVEANPYGITPSSSEDPRLTRFGRWLRRSSLDELPQFFSVILGDMSIVGPRPEMPFIVANYNEEQRERLKVKPGITGIWQISAVRGEPIHANMEYDLFYIEHQSLLLDFIIIVRTISTAIKGIGAY